MKQIVAYSKDCVNISKREKAKIRDYTNRHWASHLIKGDSESFPAIESD